MEIIVSGRGGGKTTALVKIAKEKGGIILCAHAGSRDFILRNFDIDKEQVLLPERVASTPYFRGVKRPRLYIDDADWILRRYLDAEIDAATFTGWYSEPKT